MGDDFNSRMRLYDWAWMIGATLFASGLAWLVVHQVWITFRRLL